MKAHNLTPTELENSKLADLARKAGYASLRAMLNDHNMWGSTTEEIEGFLRRSINTVDVDSISSVGIREVAKSAGIDTLTLLGTNGKSGDARVTIYQLGEVRVAETNGDSVWEEGAPAAFAELLESEGIEL